MSPSLLGTVVDAPFPGLRAFEAEESLLFYGREAHIAELLDRLGESHFVAVTGTSGSGKSSLVRAGLRPALHRGYLVDASSKWRFATMRPGGSPLDSMAASLAQAFEGVAAGEILRSLRSTSAGLSQAVARAGLAPGESLLIIADQFEELFRYDLTRDQQTDASLFVSQLLEATEQRDTAIYVVVTMRSEFLGRCSEFTGLAEAFNRSQYLVPRLTRDERREAIERPLRLVGTTPSPALVQQVLNDAGDDPDQLPVLQHVLLRTYREWQRAGSAGRLERSHYDTVGGIERALDVHGNEILSGLSEAAQKTAERLFRSLTVAQGGVALRRPRRMRELYDISGASSPQARQEVDDIVTRFARSDNSFLMLSSSTLTPATVVDITHESLIRKWKRLEAWVRAETRSAEWYADLSRDVLRYRNGEVSLWQDPQLAGVQRRRVDEGWNEAWANQDRAGEDPLYPESLLFLEESATQVKAQARSKRLGVIIRISLVVLVAITAVVAYRLVQSEQRAKALADAAQRASATVQEATSRVTALEAERAALARTPAAAASPEDKARLLELTRQIEETRAQAKSSQDELAKAKKNQELAQLDRGGLLKQIETLQQRVTQTTSDRDRLQQQLNGYQVGQTKGPSNAGTEDRTATVQKQLDDERKTSASAATEIARLKAQVESLSAQGGGGSTASLQDVTKAFGDGVRAYELGNPQAAAQYMREAIRMQSSLKQPPKEVRLSGTRFVPFAPQAYLGVALLDMKSDCALVLPALRLAEAEAVPSEIRTKVQAARSQCGGK